MQTLLPISNGHLEPRATMPPYHAYTTATPRTEVSHVDNQSLRSSNASYEHHDQKSMVRRPHTVIFTSVSIFTIINFDI